MALTKGADVINDVTPTEQEVWKDIAGYAGMYQVSSYGRVRNFKRNTLLKNSPANNGYSRMSLSKNNKVKYKEVHRLVAEAFIPNPENKCCINHKDLNKLNNYYDNLEWSSYRENNTHYHKKTNKELTGASKRNAK